MKNHKISCPIKKCLNIIYFTNICHVSIMYKSFLGFAIMCTLYVQYFLSVAYNLRPKQISKKNYYFHFVITCDEAIFCDNNK